MLTSDWSIHTYLNTDIWLDLRSTSCLIYVNGPAAALGLLSVTAITGVTSTSGEINTGLWLVNTGYVTWILNTGQYKEMAEYIENNMTIYTSKSLLGVDGINFLLFHFISFICHPPQEVCSWINSVRLLGNNLKRGGENGAMLAHCLFTFGTSYSICCAYYSSFSHRGNTTFDGEMFAHSLYCSYYKERENVYCKIISEYIYCWKWTLEEYNLFITGNVEGG